VRPALSLLFAASAARRIIAFFVRLGLFGPFLLEALSTSFFYVPLANEFLLFALIGRAGGGAWWPAYALMAAAGAVAGAFVLDLVVRRAGEKGIERFVRPRTYSHLKSKLEEHAGRVLFVAAALPPPFPFRVTLMAASALQTPRARLLTAVFFGRALRFTAESLLILYLGRRFLKYMNSDAVEYAVYAFTVVAVLGSVFTIYKLFGKR
jgi:membrane protein YqaA with SNARE-associated domain